MSVRSIQVIRFAPSITLRTLAVHGWDRLYAMIRARQTRRLLGEMDDRMLADIGVGRGEAMTEAARPMWETGARRR